MTACQIVNRLIAAIPQTPFSTGHKFNSNRLVSNTVLALITARSVAKLNVLEIYANLSQNAFNKLTSISLLSSQHDVDV